MIFWQLPAVENRSVGIETLYGLEGLEFELRLGWDFPYLSRSAVGLTILLYSGYRVTFSEVKLQECGADPPPLSSAEVVYG